MLDIDKTKIMRLEDTLKKLNDRGIPFATRFTLNGMVAKGREEMQGLIREKMITRNKFTERSVRYERTKMLDIRRQEASFGSVAPYMEAQEFGKTKRAKGKHGVPIPTSVASGEGEGVQPRRRLPRKPNKLQNIRLNDRRQAGQNRTQQIGDQIRQAAEGGDRYVFLDLQRAPGIYRITGGKRQPRIKLIWSMRDKTVRIPKNETLQPASRKAMQAGPDIYDKALRFQLDRLK